MLTVVGMKRLNHLRLLLRHREILTLTLLLSSDDVLSQDKKTQVTEKVGIAVAVLREMAPGMALARHSLHRLARLFSDVDQATTWQHSVNAHSVTQRPGQHPDSTGMQSSHEPSHMNLAVEQDFTALEDWEMNFPSLEDYLPLESTSGWPFP